MSSRIHDPKLMSQLIDFGDLSIDGYIYPTDIDGVIEYKDSEYIILEIKYGDAKVPYGQRLALERMVNDFTSVGKRAVVFICRHNVKDASKPVNAAHCEVREIYFGNEGKWRNPTRKINLRQAIDEFRGCAREVKNE